MKTLITTLLVLGIAATSNAASFSWGTGTAKAAFGSTIFNTDAYSVTGYLVLLGTNPTSTDLWTLDMDNGSIVGKAYVDEKAPTTSGNTNTRGRITNTYNDGGNGNVATGQKYGMYLVYDDGEKVWYNFSNTIVTLETNSRGGFDAQSFAFDFTTATEIDVLSGEKPSAGGGWYAAAVPEPATGALALAGIALLFKRRRA